MVERLNLKPPSIFRQVLEKIGVQIPPWCLCSNEKILSELYRVYPDLAGDRTAIGPGDDGNCQSWRDNPGWWRELISK